MKVVDMGTKKKKKVKLCFTAHENWFYCKRYSSPDVS